MSACTDCLRSFCEDLRIHCPGIHCGDRTSSVFSYYAVSELVSDCTDCLRSNEELGVDELVSDCTDCLRFHGHRIYAFGPKL